MFTTPLTWAVASRDFLGIPYDWWGPLALGLFIVVGIIFSFRLKREEREERPSSPDEMLAELHASYAAGKMDAAEFERVRASIAKMAGVALPGSAKPAPARAPAPTAPGPAAAPPSEAPPDLGALDQEPPAEA